MISKTTKKMINLNLVIPFDAEVPSKFLKKCQISEMI